MGYVKKIREKIGHEPLIIVCAGAFIYKDGKVLLQKRADNNKWATHGGCIELGDTILEALERELIEEINIIPQEPELMGIYSGKSLHHIYPNNDEVYVIEHIFLVEKYIELDKQSDGEVLETKWFNVDELPGNIHEPDLPLFNDLKEFIEKRKVIVK